MTPKPVKSRNRTSRTFPACLIFSALAGLTAGATWAASIPATLGWYQIPNTDLKSVFTPNYFGGSSYPFFDQRQYLLCAISPTVFSGFLESEYFVWRVDQPNFILTDGDNVGGYNTLMLTTYMTGKDSSISHPTAYTWYVELIVSTQPIAAPSAAQADMIAPAKPRRLRLR